MRISNSIVAGACFALFLVACGDDSVVSNDPEKLSDDDIEAETSSSFVEEDESSSSSKKDNQKSSSSEKDEQGASSSSAKDLEEVLSSSEVASSSSKKVVSSSSVGGNPNVNQGSLFDDRDGKIYRVVKIGDQVWMAENLNYDDSVATPVLKGNSWCYEEKAEKCAAFGRLYAWEAAKEVCPSGWHLPTNDEFKTLIAYIGDQYTAGKYLKSQNGWTNDRNGTDDYGFSALPAGYWREFCFDVGEGEFFCDVPSREEGYVTYYWSATESVHGNVFGMELEYYEGTALISRHDKSSGFSVRCIQGLPPQSSSAVRIESSSSEVWDWSVPKEAYLNPNVNYGTMTDERDGKVYKTVKIGNQVWMAENLNYADSVKTPSLIGRSTCYDDDPDNCNITGRMYSWVAAIDSVALATDAENPRECGPGKYCDLDGIQGICPVGWHLPSRSEWETLIEAVGGKFVAGKVLKSRAGWFSYEMEDEDAIASGNGTDDYGFSVLPAGEWLASAGPKGNGFDRLGTRAVFWFSGGSTFAFGLGDGVGVLGIVSCYDDIYGRRICSDSYRFSVRCVKD